MRIIQKLLHEQLRAEATATREKLAPVLRSLPVAKLSEHPEPNGWSIGQVLEHLLVTDELYDAPLSRLMAKARPDAGAPFREWKSSFIGGMIAESLIKPKALKGPKAFTPRESPRNGVVEALLGREMKFIEVMDAAATLDWRALRIGSPALPRWAPKMNLGDGFRIHTVHLTRHARQIERLAGKL